MFALSYIRSARSACKRLKIPPPSLSNAVWPPCQFSSSAVHRQTESVGATETSETSQMNPDTSEEDENDRIRLPRSVQAVYLRPLRRQAEYGVPSCNLQLRSYSVRNVEFFADFALRAAYYLNLPAAGPTPLPKIVERWTVPRSNFVHKKSQENFERITLRRLIQIKDGHPEVVQTWLAFLKKHAFYGVGMKANVWEHEELDVGKSMDRAFADLEQSLEQKLSQFGRKKDSEVTTSVADLISQQKYRQPGVPLTEVRKG